MYLPIYLENLFRFLCLVNYFALAPQTQIFSLIFFFFSLFSSYTTTLLQLGNQIIKLDNDSSRKEASLMQFSFVHLFAFLISVCPSICTCFLEIITPTHMLCTNRHLLGYLCQIAVAFLFI